MNIPTFCVFLLPNSLGPPANWTVSLRQDSFTQIMMGFSAQTKCAQTQDLIDAKLDRRRKGPEGSRIKVCGWSFLYDYIFLRTVNIFCISYILYILLCWVILKLFHIVHWRISSCTRDFLISSPMSYSKLSCLYCTNWMIRIFYTVLKLIWDINILSAIMSLMTWTLSK